MRGVKEKGAYYMGMEILVRLDGCVGYINVLLLMAKILEFCKRAQFSALRCDATLCSRQLYPEDLRTQIRFAQKIYADDISPTNFTQMIQSLHLH